MLTGYRTRVDMLLKNSDKSVNFRYVFLPLASRLTACGSLLLGGGFVVGRTLGLRGVCGFGNFCSMGVCLSLGLGVRQDGFLQNIADKPGKSAPWVILPKRRCVTAVRQERKRWKSGRRQMMMAPDFRFSDLAEIVFWLLSCSSVRRRVGLPVPCAFLPLSLEGSDYPSLIIKNG